MSAPAAESVLRAGLGDAGLRATRAKLVVMPPWMHAALSGRIAAITVGRCIFISPSRFEAVVAGQDPELLAHELIHVGQWEEQGLRVFLLRYVADYLRLRWCGLGHQEAYRHIGFEWEAYAGARHIVDRL